MITLSDESRQILSEGIEDFNDRLVTQSINLSGQAFNNAFRLGCSVLALPVVIVLVVSYFADRFSMISILVYGCAGALIALMFAAVVSTRAKAIAVRENYQQDINPEIVRFLAGQGFTRAQFDLLAAEILAENAPLRDYLVPGREGV